MLKKILKGIIGALVIGVGLLVGLIVILDKNEEKIYDKFGKEKVLEFMKPFEPFIVMEPDKGEEEIVEGIDDLAGQVRMDLEEAVESIEEEVEAF